MISIRGTTLMIAGESVIKTHCPCPLPIEHRNGTSVVSRCDAPKEPRAYSFLVVPNSGDSDSESRLARSRLQPLSGTECAAVVSPGRVPFGFIAHCLPSGAQKPPNGRERR
jgi:hypothetical protein